MFRSIWNSSATELKPKLSNTLALLQTSVSSKHFFNKITWVFWQYLISFSPLSDIISNAKHSFFCYMLLDLLLMELIHGRGLFSGFYGVIQLNFGLCVTKHFFVHNSNSQWHIYWSKCIHPISKKWVFLIENIYQKYILSLLWSELF